MIPAPWNWGSRYVLPPTPNARSQIQKAGSATPWGPKPRCCIKSAVSAGFTVFGGGVGENRGIGSLTGPKLNYDFARVALTYIELCWPQ